MNAWNRNENRAGEYVPGVSSSGANELAEFSEMLGILSHRTNRRILCHLIQHEEGLSVERLATRTAEPRTLPATDGVVSSAERNSGDIRP